MARIDESRPFIPVRIAVMTVSDTRTTADDKSAPPADGAVEQTTPPRRERRVCGGDQGLFWVSAQ